MRRVWKYPLAGTLGWKPVPYGKVVLLGLDPGGKGVAVWIEFTDAAPARQMAIFATGEEIPDGAVHVGSVIDGEFVWHVYERELGDG